MEAKERDFIKGFSINSAGYGIIPKLVMMDRDLHVTAKAIYAYFCSYTGAGDTCFPSRKKICYDLNIAFDTFSRHLKTLITSGYIKVEQIKENGRFSHNLYTLCDSILPCTENTVSENSVYGKSDTINNIDKNNSNNKINITKERNIKERKVEKVEKERDINFEQENSNKECEINSQKAIEKNNTGKNTGSLSKIKNDTLLIKEAEKEKKKNSAKRKKESGSFNSIIHSYTNNEEMQELLTEFVEIRTKIKKPLTPSSLKRILKVLDRVSLEDGGNGTEEEKIKIIERTVINSWQSFYSLQNNTQISPVMKKVHRVKEKPSYDLEDFDNIDILEEDENITTLDKKYIEVEVQEND